MLAPLAPLATDDLQAIHAKALGLVSTNSPWDFVAEAWRSALWAYCHPHWQPVSTQRLSNLFLDLAAPGLGPSGLEEAKQVRDHLTAVGDLIRLPGGEWLPAPLKLITLGAGLDLQLIGGMPSWVLPKVHPAWVGSPGFRRTSHAGISLHHVDLEEWCQREAREDKVPTLSEALALVEALPAQAYTPTPTHGLVNRALAHPGDPPVGSWVQVKDTLTHRLLGIAVHGQEGWFLRTLPPWVDGRMAHRICQTQSGGQETWRAIEGGKETLLKLYVKLPNWHWQVLLCTCLRPPVQDPIHHQWTVMIPPPCLDLLQALVFTPLQMIRS